MKYAGSIKFKIIPVFLNIYSYIFVTAINLTTNLKWP